MKYKIAHGPNPLLILFFIGFYAFLFTAIPTYLLPVRKYLVPDSVFHDMTKLIHKDGLAVLPELGAKNTVESRMHATYLITVMTEGERINTLRSLLSAQTLQAYAIDNSHPVQHRLEAYYVLQAIGESQDGVVFAQHVMENQPRVITTLDQLREYVRVATPALKLDYKAQRSALQLKTSESEQNALLTIALEYFPYTYMFSNLQSATSLPFPSIRPTLLTWAQGNARSAAEFLVAIFMLHGTELSLDKKKEIAKRFIGCNTSGVMISTAGGKTNCSLTNTYYFYMNSLWIYFEI